MKCPGCGAESTGSFCPFCGRSLSQTEAETAEQPASPTIETAESRYMAFKNATEPSVSGLEPIAPTTTPVRSQGGIIAVLSAIGHCLVLLIGGSLLLVNRLQQQAREEAIEETAAVAIIREPDHTWDLSIPADAMTGEEIAQMYRDGDPFVGRTIALSGQVFGTPEYDSEGVYFWMCQSPQDYTGDTMVFYPDPSFDVEDQDFVILTGAVTDMQHEEGYLGANLSLPVITADGLQVTDYATAMAPTHYYAQPDTATVTQHGCAITVEKVEFSDTETRVFVTIQNDSRDEFWFYYYSSQVYQDGQWLDATGNYMADYPEPEDELRPGETTSGVIVFPPVEPEALHIRLEGNSDNYELEFSPYSFEVSTPEPVG